MRVVQFRPDTWVFRFAHTGPQQELDDAHHAAEGAAAGRWVAWGADTVVSRMRTRGALAFRTSLLRGKATRGTTEVTVGAVACATLSPGDCYGLASTVARRFGELEDCTLQRIDLAADISHARPCDVAADDWVVLGSPRKVSVQQWHTGRHMTGWTVAPGNALKLNLYDKRVELRRPESEHKRSLEEAAWHHGGWDGASPVARLEFQLGRRVCKELQLEPGDVPIDATWAYLTNRWARLIDHASHTRRDRADLHPIWRAAREARWEGPAVSLERHRHRAGPTAACAVGTVRSLLASRGELPGESTVDAYAAAFADLAARELRTQRPAAELEHYLGEHHTRAAAVYGPQKPPKH